MAHTFQQAGLAGRGSPQWGGRVPRRSTSPRYTRADAQLYRGIGVMFDTPGYAVFLHNMDQLEDGTMMRARNGHHIMVRDPALARRLDSETGVALPLHFKLELAGTCGVLNLPRSSRWLPSTIITDRKGIRFYNATRSEFLVRAGCGESLFLVWPGDGTTFEVEDTMYQVSTRMLRHRWATRIERLESFADAESAAA